MRGRKRRREHEREEERERERERGREVGREGGHVGKIEGVRAEDKIMRLQDCAIKKKKKITFRSSKVGYN